MNHLTIYKVSISIFIIVCLYLIQLSSKSEYWSNYTSALWIVFMAICVGMYFIGKYQKRDTSNKDDK